MNELLPTEIAVMLWFFAAASSVYFAARIWNPRLKNKKFHWGRNSTGPVASRLSLITVMIGIPLMLLALTADRIGFFQSELRFAGALASGAVIACLIRDWVMKKIEPNHTAEPASPSRGGSS